MGNRRSTPDLETSQRSLSDLYPSALDSDPKELAQQLTDVLTQHARAHERHVRHAVAFNTRMGDLEGKMDDAKQQVEGLDESITRKFTKLERTVNSGFADVKLERAVERTKVKTAVAVLAVVWSVLSVLGGAAWHYITKPSCKEGEALMGDSCVQVTVVKK